MEFFFCGLLQQLRLLRVQIEKNYPRCSLDDVIMGHIKLNNNIPISPDKWIYEQDINPIIYERNRYFHMLNIKNVGLLSMIEIVLSFISIRYPTLHM